MNHLTYNELEQGLDNILQSPKDEGILDLIVCRPAEGERKVLPVGQLGLAEGLEGDNWLSRGCRHTDDGSAHPEMQLNIMNSRVIDLIAQSKERWPEAGDQLFVDLDLSEDNLPSGSQLQIGTAIIQITSIPHKGCKKFVTRFGADSMKFVNSPLGKQLHLRGLNAKVVQDGVITTGDVVRKLV